MRDFHFCGILFFWETSLSLVEACFSFVDLSLSCGHDFFSIVDKMAPRKTPFSGIVQG
jgi:hypothetical protein